MWIVVAVARHFPSKPTCVFFSKPENCFIMQCIDLGLFIQRQILKNYKFDLHLQFSDTKNCNAVMIEGLVLILHGGYN